MSNDLILIVEDSSAQRMVLQEKLESKGYTVIAAENGADASQKLRDSNAVSAILLDWELPDATGPELMQDWFETAPEKMKFIPVLMLTGKTNPSSLQTALDAGATDYLKKPANDVELFARLTNSLRMRTMQLQLRDVAQRDPLTGLYNRRHLKTILEKMAENSRSGPQSCAILDIDFFKKINDGFGHQIGDEVLKKLAQILLVKARSCDTVARYGGEEFVITFPDTSGKKANICAIRILEEVRRFDWSSIAEGLSVTFSCGVSEYKDGMHNIEKWIGSADEALYVVKEMGRNNVLLDTNIQRYSP